MTVHSIHQSLPRYYLNDLRQDQCLFLAFWVLLFLLFQVFQHTSRIDISSKIFTYNEFVRQFHQSRITNLQSFLTNISYDFFFNQQTETKKNCIRLIGKLFSFSTAQTENNQWNKLVKKMVETSGELVIRINKLIQSNNIVKYVFRTALLHSERIIYFYIYFFVCIPLPLDLVRIYSGPLPYYFCWCQRLFKIFASCGILMGMGLTITIRVKNKAVEAFGTL